MGTVRKSKQMKKVVKKTIKKIKQQIYPFEYTEDKDGYRYGIVNGWYTSEHRWVYAKSIGLNVWDLDGDIVIHHKDHNRKNNDPENLEAFTPKDAKRHDWGVFRHPRGGRAVDLPHCEGCDCEPKTPHGLYPMMSTPISFYLGRELRDGEHLEIVKGKIELWQDDRNTSHCIGCQCEHLQP